MSGAAASEALGLAWLRVLNARPRELEFDPTELAALAARCPTVAILRAALPDLEAMGFEAWAGMAFGVIPAEERALLVEYLELHEWLVLHVLVDSEPAFPGGPEAAALLRAALDPDSGRLRFGRRGR